MGNHGNDDATWAERERPATLSKRFTFASYAENRDFLDRVAALSEQTGIHPDLSFGRDYANLSVHPAEGEVLRDEERDFARRVDAIVAGSG
ncbi:4a-hydroxytetrahydrobiopterin dehydratase [Sinisalibacter lacisalsi]|uniref:4a-hydroxytetrahydrobiopterin dehydratase n=1 Tax=Sinisalibacter lacisalsi TaxID=1526570 RepID=A0ABQ1QPF4_9RHOB|nr:4a-hydroxytetrahydrobiopterin dehydratase [Sinisalibacter lacisalsi]GGD39519.1 pterin-4-alpha-carbinolamine dehydratase [Sinisalibacter lacisalsi]